LGSGDGDDGDDDDEKATTAARGGGKEEFSASEGKCMIGISFFFYSFVSLKEEGHQFMPQRMRSFKLWHKGSSQMPCKNFPLDTRVDLTTIVSTGFIFFARRSCAPPVRVMRKLMRNWVHSRPHLSIFRPDTPLPVFHQLQNRIESKKNRALIVNKHAQRVPCPLFNVV